MEIGLIRRKRLQELGALVVPSAAEIQVQAQPQGCCYSNQSISLVKTDARRASVANKECDTRVQNLGRIPALYDEVLTDNKQKNQKTATNRQTNIKPNPGQIPMPTPCQPGLRPPRYVGGIPAQVELAATGISLSANLLTLATKSPILFPSWTSLAPHRSASPQHIKHTNTSL